MVAGSILPFSVNSNGDLVFLFGKENDMEDSAKGWSDFGGRCEGNETPFLTALREGAEELSFFLGDSKDIKKLLNKYGFFHFSLNNYHVHLFYLDFDPLLPIYYNANHKFLWDKMDKHFLNNSRFFEKIEIKWFTIDELIHKRRFFRPFYRNIVDIILNNDTINHIHNIIP